MENLTSLLKAKTLNEFIGQKHLIGKDKALYKLIEKKDIPHLFFYGKPGTGKTTLAKIIAQDMQLDFYYFNATTIKIDELRVVFKRYENTLMKPLIFIDEVHRLSKNQQEVLLPVMEDYSVIVIGASTENPFFTLTSAIRSRSFLFEFKAHTIDDLTILLNRAISILENITIDDESKEYLLYGSGGDARALLNLLDYAYKVNSDITVELLKELRASSMGDGVSSKDSHYDLASAMIKSIRGSDIDASIYYLARLIDGGESVEFITRRLVISASEDIGNANPNAIMLATSIQAGANKIGFPEAKILLSQCVVYLASSPKSRSSYSAINQALNEIQNGKILEVPMNIKDKHIGYKNPHDFGGY
ncbi:MAG: replication-associated recombination protein A, partial [Arcobacteraceae bacterium]|nr:replication-associated recombination protein A [Arcobacteraceae bacterium]